MKAAKQKKGFGDNSKKPVFTKRQLEILEERRASLLSGKDTGIDWQTMHNNIRENRQEDDAIEKMVLLEKINIGLTQSKAGEVVSMKEAKMRLKKWIR